MMSMDSSSPWLASFGRRKGRVLKPEQKQALEQLYPVMEVPCREDTINDPLAWYGVTVREVWFEIGFGKGEHIAAQAEAYPDIGFIGCETYINGMASLLQRQQHNKLANLRVSLNDARHILANIKDGVLGRVFILFPDPWPKKKHLKRRLITAAFLDLLAQKMRPGAELRIVTDHADYAQWTLHHLLLHPKFSWLAKTKQDWQTPPLDWVRTRYQEKAEMDGRTATYLRFICREGVVC